MAGTPGRTAFEAYVNAHGINDAQPWEQQDQRAWEKAAAGLKHADPEQPEGDETGESTELHLDAAHEEG